MTRQSLWFDAPRHVTLREEAMPAPAAGEVRVKTHASAISPGTEMLIYRGEFPEGMAADEGIAATQATVSRDLDDLGAVKVRVPILKKAQLLCATDAALQSGRARRRGGGSLPD